MQLKPLGMATLVMCVIACGGAAHGQNFPSKTVRIVTAAPGGGNDVVARLIAQGITGALGQPVVVENRPSGVIPGETVAKAAPDGYTVLVASGALWIGPLIQHSPYDPVKDFAPVSSIGKAPLLLVTHPTLPVKSVRDLIALAKSRPGELNYSSAGTGSTSHLAGELFKAMTGANIVRVSYKGSATETADLISGQVHLSFGTFTSVMVLAKSGKLKALAVTGMEPSALAPELPTVAASGVPGYEFLSIYGMFAPAKTPDSAVKRLNQELGRFLGTSDTRERFAVYGVETGGGSPEQLAATVKSQMTIFGKLIRDTGMREN